MNSSPSSAAQADWPEAAVPHHGTKWIEADCLEKLYQAVGLIYVLADLQSAWPKELLLEEQHSGRIRFSSRTLRQIPSS